MCNFFTNRKQKKRIKKQNFVKKIDTLGGIL